MVEGDTGLLNIDHRVVERNAGISGLKRLGLVDGVHLQRVDALDGASKVARLRISRQWVELAGGRYGTTRLLAARSRWSLFCLVDR